MDSDTSVFAIDVRRANKEAGIGSDQEITTKMSRRNGKPVRRGKSGTTRTRRLGAYVTWDAALTQLRGLPASGPGSFEVFIADALAEVTGTGFRLMKSGSQGGADALSNAWTGFVLTMEAKRYFGDTTLPLDALRAKVMDLAHEHSQADLWVLAATRKISAGDETALCKTGDGLGVDVLVLDARPGAGGVSPLLVLCAAARNAVRRHWPESIELPDLLDAIRAEPGFVEGLTTLRNRLHSADVGYEQGRRASAVWLRRAMTDLAVAKADLGSHADLLSDQNRTRIGRKPAAACLGNLSTGASRLHALVGGEGMGKTWAVLDWWNSTAGDDGSGQPLTIWLKAADLRGGKPRTP